MWISKFRLTSYFSFLDTEWIELSPSFNVFVGANNSGKTALLKAFASHFQNSPHRNSEKYRENELPASLLELDISISIDEILKRHTLGGSVPRFPGSRNTGPQLLGEFLSDPSRICTLQATKSPGGPFYPRNNASIAELRSSHDQTAFHVSQTSAGWQVTSNAGAPDNLTDVMNFQSDPAIFYFEPQRLHVGSVAFLDQRVLESSAANLPNVLLHLQGSRPAVFERIIQNVAEISQSVRSIRAAPNGSNVEIILWPTTDYSRSEFSFTLAESGTGIGQLIAIITAAATNDQCTIVIDEINTFLHPSATKRLISILKSEYSHHQYIISSHYSDVISCIGAERIHLVKKSNFTSKVVSISPADAAGVRNLASELGFSMMDVFGHERLVWLEGETELVAFPYLLRTAGRTVPNGVGFSTVASAGDFDARSRSVKSIVEMYKHVAESAAPLLKGLSFGLDREGNSDEAVKKLQTSKRKLRFLPRRCLECYILDEDAVASILSEMDGHQHQAQTVRDFFAAKGGDAKYRAGSQWKGDHRSASWLKRVDAAKLLTDCFATLSSHRTEYRKTRDTMKIIQHIVARDKSQLSELTDFVESLVQLAMRDTKP
jgi:ABC-type cobalamin/Fe3+-siderophores transport system ATPase subunit